MLLDGCEPSNFFEQPPSYVNVHQVLFSYLSLFVDTLYQPLQDKVFICPQDNKVRA